MTQWAEPLDLNSLPDKLYYALGEDTHQGLVQNLVNALRNDLLVSSNDQRVTLNALLEPFDRPPSL